MSELPKTQTPNSRFRKPPIAGGPRRVDQRGAGMRGGRQETITHRRQQKKSRLKKALPYLVPAIATGGSVALMSGITNYLIG